MGIIRWVGRGVALGGAVAAGGALFVTARHVLTTPQPLRSGLEGEAKIDRAHGGDLYYTIAGPEDGEPVVLLHDFYSGASSYEYRSVFARLARQYRVYAPDWLGFGMSERPPLAFTGEFYATALAGFLRDVVQRPAIVIAQGRAANVAARAASDEPELFARLALISPEIEAGVRLDPTVAQTAVRTAQRALLGMAPYALLSTRPVLRRLALGRGDGAASEEALDHQYASAHQFGGQYALLALLTGELDLPIQQEAPLIQPPLLFVAGERDTRHPRGIMEELVILNPYAELEIIPAAGASVCEDQPLRFLATLSAWIARPAARQRPYATRLTPGEAHAAQRGGAEENAAPEDGPAPPPEVPDLPEDPDGPEVPEVEPEVNHEPPTPPQIAPEPSPEPSPDATATSTASAPHMRATSAKPATKSDSDTTSAQPTASAPDESKPATRKRSTTTAATNTKSGAAAQSSASTKKSASKTSSSKASSRAKKATPREGA
jgi:pimeloyl-ACP methyl ester carboxylesterase